MPILHVPNVSNRIHVQGLRPLMESTTLVSGGLFSLHFLASDKPNIIEAQSNIEPYTSMSATSNYVITRNHA